MFYSRVKLERGINNFFNDVPLSIKLFLDTFELLPNPSHLTFFLLAFVTIHRKPRLLVYASSELKKNFKYISFTSSVWLVYGVIHWFESHVKLNSIPSITLQSNVRLSNSK